MASYILFLYDSPTASANLSPEEMQRIIEKYEAWSGSLGTRYLGGDKLKDGEGRVLRRQSRKVRVIDGPYSETKEVIGGFMTIDAADYEEAVRLAETCPHLDFGGTIEIREVESL